MTTYADLQTKVSRSLRDEGNNTFSVTMVKDMISAAWAEISDIACERFQEDITPIDGQRSYQLRSAEFDDPNDDIELQRVEVWDGSGDVPVAWRFVEPQASHPTGLSFSEAGWRTWAGNLELPTRVVDMIDPSKHTIRVWGYSPWPLVEADDDVIPFGPKLQEGIILLCYIEALRRLLGSRVLFTQWQTRSNNTDVTMGSLASDLNLNLDDWRRKALRIRVLREAP